MKQIIALPLLALLFTGCATVTPSSTTTSSSPISSTLSNATVQSGVQLTLETAGNLAILKASPSDRVVIANQLVQVGNAINILASGGVVTPTALNATLSSFSPKVASQAAVYQTFSSLAETTWASYYPQVVANGDSATAIAWIKVISQAAINVGTANGATAAN